MIGLDARCVRGYVTLSFALDITRLLLTVPHLIQHVMLRDCSEFLVRGGGGTFAGERVPISYKVSEGGV